MELTELDFNDNDYDNSGFGKSSNFGGGLELLMNDKIKDSKQRPSSDIELDDLNNLENELNDLVDDIPSSSFKPSSDFFNKPSVSFDEGPSIKLEGHSDTSLGRSTAQTENDSKTWDGYGKFNNIPLNPDKAIPLEPKMSKEELLREKFKYLRKLEALEKKGVELSKKYNMESSLQEMMGEYETIMDEKSKQNSVKFQGNMLMAVINGIEFLNGKFDPFDIKLDGWSEQIQENITDYDEIFSELHEKYKSKASMAPELKLLFQLGGSAMMVHMSNKICNAMPGMDDILRQNPDLMHQFQTAAVNSMASKNPGFSGFMSGLMNPNGGNYSEPQNPRGSGPPPPLATQGPNAIPTPTNRPGNNNYNSRPDVTIARGAVFDDGINIRETSIGVPGFEPPQPAQRSSRRPDMKGPSDLGDILSGLKTKTITVNPAPQPQYQQNSFIPPAETINIQDNNNSTISIEDLKSIQSEANVPKRSRRKQKSDKNTVSLDI